MGENPNNIDIELPSFNHIIYGKCHAIGIRVEFYKATDMTPWDKDWNQVVLYEMIQDDERWYPKRYPLQGWSAFWLEDYQDVLKRTEEYLNLHFQKEGKGWKIKDVQDRKNSGG